MTWARFLNLPGVLVVPNPDLRPEYLYNIDLGASREFGKMLLAEASVFWSYLDNAMVRREFLFNGEPTFVFQGEWRARSMPWSMPDT